MREEAAQLWQPVGDLWQTKQYEQAIALCRTRLADPFAFMSEPRAGSVEELCVMGRFFLGRLLLAHAERVEEEAVEQLRVAKVGFEAYYPDALALRASVVGCLADLFSTRGSLVDAAREYQHLVTLHTRIFQQDKTNDVVLDLLAAQRNHARCLSKLGQHPAALARIHEAMAVLKTCGAQKSRDVRFTAGLVETILDQACYILESGGDPDDALRDITAATELFNKVTDAETSVERANDVMANYASRLAYFARTLSYTNTPTSRQFSLDLFDSVTETFHNAIELPNDRAEGLPESVGTAYCLLYAQAIVHYASSSLGLSLLDDAVGGEEEEYEIAVLDRALEMVFLSTYTPTTVPLLLRRQQFQPSSDAHAFYLSDDFTWPALDIPQTLLALTILNLETTKRIEQLKRSSGSSRRGFGRVVGGVVRAEIARVVALVNDLKTTTTTMSGEVQKYLDIHLATALLNRGRIELRTSRALAKASWMEARELLRVAATCELVEMEVQRVAVIQALETYLAK